MKIGNQQSFRGISPYNITAGLENNVLLNKAIFDITGSDVPWVVMANNKEERRERINRAMLSFGLIFVSPLVILPLVNRVAMKNVAKLTDEIFSRQYNAVKLSNKYLINAKETEKGLNELSEELKIDFKPIVDKAGGDYEKIRLQLIKAKNTVLASDFALVTGTFGHIGFFNSWLTKKKTGQSGYSAEMTMADKSVIEKRAEKYEKTGKLRYGAFFISLVGLIAAVPLGIKHGLSLKKVSKFGNFIKKHAEKFDYNDAIFMKRWPLALSLASAQLGICLASRNQTELKDNAIRSSVGYAIFFGGDILLASYLSRLSDKTLKTNIMKKQNTNVGFMEKILPTPTKMKELAISGSKQTKIAAASIFWFNLLFLSALTGFAIPVIINKIIRKDVSKDITPDSKSQTSKVYYFGTKSEQNTKPKIFQQFGSN